MEMHDHFSNVARKYRHLRTTDVEPILIIKDNLRTSERIEAADVGCGAGRYDLQLFRNLGERLYLFCLDYNRQMLEELSDYLSRHGVKGFEIAQAPAETLPLGSRSLDCVFTFNAIHHFDIEVFLAEASRVLKEGGRLFIYTRLRSQNRRSIWGQYFPRFNEKETRLYELDSLKEKLRKTPELRLGAIQFFKYRRRVNLGTLVRRARNRHYSTFHMYSDRELEEALARFKQNLQQDFSDLDNVSWFDENVLLVVEKGTDGQQRPATQLLSTQQLAAHP